MYKEAWFLWSMKVYAGEHEWKNRAEVQISSGKYMP